MKATFHLGQSSLRMHNDDFAFRSDSYYVTTEANQRPGIGWFDKPRIPWAPLTGTT